jgi:hypothetical protein
MYYVLGDKLIGWMLLLRFRLIFIIFILHVFSLIANIGLSRLRRREITDCQIVVLLKT